MTIKRLRDQKPYDEDEYRKNETLKEKDDPYKCVRETEAAQANFTALTKTWPLLSTNQKNFCSQKPFEHGQVWRNYMACVGIKAQKLQPREPEFFVRKMVCQDDNAPEVGSKYIYKSQVSSLHYKLQKTPTQIPDKMQIRLDVFLLIRPLFSFWKLILGLSYSVYQTWEYAFKNSRWN